MVLVARYLIFLLPLYLLYLWFKDSQDAGRRKLAILVLISSVFSLVISVTISSLYFHPRPFAVGVGLTLISHAPDSSFPSDHASLLFAASFSLMMLGSPKPGVAFFLVSTLVGLARVFVGIHFPSDIAGGLVIGLGSSAVVFWLRERLDPFMLSIIRLYQRITSFLGRGSPRNRSDGL